MMNSSVKACILFAGTALIAGCGGGGSSSNSPSGPPENITVSIYPDYALYAGTFYPQSAFGLYVDGKYIEGTGAQSIPYSANINPVTSTAVVSLSPGTHTVGLINSVTADIANEYPPARSYPANTSVSCFIGFSGPTAFNITPPNLPQESVTSYGPAQEGQIAGNENLTTYFTIVIP